MGLVTLCLFGFVFMVVPANADELENLIDQNPGFEENFSGWSQQIAGGAVAVFDIDRDSIEGKRCVHADVLEVTGSRWHVGLYYENLTLEEGQKYTVDFFARADANRSIAAQAKALPPNHVISTGEIDINGEWKEYSHTFTSDGDYPGNGLVAFWLGEAKAEIWIDGVRMYKGEKRTREEATPERGIDAECKLIFTWAAVKTCY
jgi:hypothetical protein